MQVVRDDLAPWTNEKIDIQVDPAYLPSSEERSVMLQVGLVLLEDTLVPLLVFLWRDEMSLYLRRQSDVWKFGKNQSEKNISLISPLSSRHSRWTQ